MLQSRLVVESRLESDQLPSQEPQELGARSQESQGRRLVHLRLDNDWAHWDPSHQGTERYSYIVTISLGNIKNTWLV